MIVVLDCNIWVTLIINRKLDFIDELVRKHIEIASCQTLRSEITDVLSRSKFVKIIDKEKLIKIHKVHDMLTRYYVINDIPHVVSDKKDNYLFALCLAAKANYFVTGDKLLLKQERYQSTAVITFAQLREMAAKF